MALVTVKANVAFDLIYKDEVFIADPDSEPRIAGLIEGGYLTVLDKEDGDGDPAGPVVSAGDQSDETQSS